MINNDDDSPCFVDLGEPSSYFQDRLSEADSSTSSSQLADMSLTVAEYDRRNESFLLQQQSLSSSAKVGWKKNRLFGI